MKLVAPRQVFGAIYTKKFFPFHKVSYQQDFVGTIVYIFKNHLCSSRIDLASIFFILEFDPNSQFICCKIPYSKLFRTPIFTSSKNLSCAWLSCIVPCQSASYPIYHTNTPLLETMFDIHISYILQIVQVSQVIFQAFSPCYWSFYSYLKS